MHQEVRHEHYKIIDNLNNAVYDFKLELYFKFIYEMNGPLTQWYQGVRSVVERQLLEDLYANSMERMD